MPLPSITLIEKEGHHHGGEKGPFTDLGADAAASGYVGM